MSRGEWPHRLLLCWSHVEECWLLVIILNIAHVRGSLCNIGPSQDAHDDIAWVV